MKKIICVVLFLALAVGLTLRTVDIVFPKAENRYFILEQYLREHDTDYDVHVYGSCHSYTSFDPIHLEQSTGIPAFVYANPGEIIPTTYVRMAQQFREYTPKIAILDIWGINPYETYDSTYKILEYYLPPSIEILPNSDEKQEVIADFDSLDPLLTNYPFFKYKDRILDGTLTEIDFKYRFENIKPYTTNYIFEEMTARLANNGFRPYPSSNLEDYPNEQKTVPHFHFQQIEPVIVKYLQKIFDLCKENGVTLILYRAPYVSSEAELRKLHHLQQLCDQNGVIFLDTEQELTFDYTADFHDYQHLSQTGARKVTDFLTPYIRQALNSEAPTP